MAIKKKKRSLAELEAEIKYLRRGGSIQIIASIVNKFFLWGGISFIAFCSYKSIAALAGKNTFADMNFMASF